MKNLGELQKSKCALILVDLQEKLFRVMSGQEELLRNSLKLISGIRALKIPIIVTEQYPNGIGKTIEPVINALGSDYNPISKLEFSCFGNEDFVKELKGLKGVDNLIIMGIEAHVCIFQTVMDALKKGYGVHLITDAVSSRSVNNKKIGIDRCASMGAFLSCTEMALFQLLKKAGTVEFKSISKILK
jgi:nicotinamidase-related amidase